MRTALRASGCSNCRFSILQAFTALAGSPQPRQSPRHPLPAYAQRRLFTSTITSRINHLPEDDAAVQESLETTPEASEPVVPSTLVDSSVPWYLQVDSPARETRPLSERQKIPDLPDGSPVLLQPLLEQISVDLGIDDLTLLDLRHLDPPPALGANLIMIIGTARSEKHLHVSADRLCRWLRSNYKLRPDADGLLGRNEIKLRLRRKAKRAKLLGSKDAEDMDDGVRTGWVCVNVGTVDGTVKHMVEEQDFVGFGRRSDGVKIVVQMLTEEKRQEIDLEKLWSGISRRQTLAEEELATNESKSLPGDDEGFPHEPAVTTIPQSTIFSPSSIQSRGYHTSARHSMSTQSHYTKDSSDEYIATQPVPDNLQVLMEKSLAAIDTGDYAWGKKLLADGATLDRELADDGWRLCLLHNLVRHIEFVPPDTALQMLGSGPDDHSSTPFLSIFHQTALSVIGFAQSNYQLWLYSFARKLGHPEYSGSKLQAALHDMVLAGVPISTESWHLVLRSMLMDVETHGDTFGKADHQNIKHALDRVVHVLQAMHSRGEETMHENIFLTINETIASAADTKELESLPENFDLPAHRPMALQRRIDQLMFNTVFPIKTDSARIHLMNIFAQHDNWTSFWALFRSIARELKPRSAELYATLFQRVAETGHERGVTKALRTWVVEMDREVPAVPLEGDVREAVEACLRIVDPDAEAKAQIRGAVGEWIPLWRRCLAAPS